MRKRTRDLVMGTLRERNKMAQELGAAKTALECIASELRVITMQNAVRLPVLEEQLDKYFQEIGRAWRDRP